MSSPVAEENGGLIEEKLTILFGMLVATLVFGLLPKAIVTENHNSRK